MKKEYDIIFDEYDFNHQPGRYRYRLRYKRMAKTGSMTLFLEKDDGTKHMASVYPDRDYLGADYIPVGTLVSVEYVRSVNGTVYVKSIK